MGLSDDQPLVITHERIGAKVAFGSRSLHGSRLVQRRGIRAFALQSLDKAKAGRENAPALFFVLSNRV
jgi:hypothetical protein